MEQHTFKILDTIQVRVLGSLIEKMLATPQSYPMTLNALVNACNQKTSRHPITQYNEREVMEALDVLNRHPLRLVGTITGDGNRVPKYRQNAKIAFELDEAEVAALAVMLLRGAQTIGEVRNNVGAMYHYESFEQVERIIEALAAREMPLVVQLPRQVGKKEVRYMHLLAGEPDLEALQAETQSQASGDKDRIAQLVADVEALKNEIKAIKEALGME